MSPLCRSAMVARPLQPLISCDIDLKMLSSRFRIGELSRRSLLKSASLLLGTSAVASTIPVLATDMSSESKVRSRPQGVTSSLNKPMVGFMLAHEQFPVTELVQLGVTAEEAGFDLLATSDHLQPWQANEGHAGQAWITLSALGARTRRVWIGPTVPCPLFATTRLWWRRPLPR